MVAARLHVWRSQLEVAGDITELRATLTSGDPLPDPRAHGPLQACQSQCMNMDVAMDQVSTLKPLSAVRAG
jgi:hypothetical protein